METNLPKDPVMLLSFVNTQLRDHYASLQEFCIAYDVVQEKLTETLLEIDYRYDSELNKFI